MAKFYWMLLPILLGACAVQESLSIQGPAGSHSPRNELELEDAAITGIRWEARVFAQTVSFQGDSYLLGGSGAAGFLNDVWKKNGEIWEKVTANAPWEGRSQFQAFVFKNRLYVMGGIGENGPLNDVWWSIDGVNWQQESTKGEKLWEPRSEFQAIVWFSDNAKEYLYVMGGRGEKGLLRDIWRTKDGVKWHQVKGGGKNRWSERASFGAVALNDPQGPGNKQLLFVFGGEGEKGWLNDVWVTKNGVKWDKMNSAPWSPRAYMQTASFTEGGYSVGGLTEEGTSSEVWRLFFSEEKKWTWASEPTPAYEGEAPLGSSLLWPAGLSKADISVNNFGIGGGCHGYSGRLGNQSDTRVTVNFNNFASCTNQSWEQELVNNQILWVEVPFMPNVQGITANSLDGLYVVFHTNNELWVSYKDPMSSDFYIRAQFPFPGHLEKSGVLLHDEIIIYVLGGRHNGVASSTIYRIDLSLNTITEAGNLPGGIYDFQVVYDGAKAFLLGGKDAQGNAVSYRSTNLNDWTSISQLGVEGINLIQFAAIQGPSPDLLLIIGGRDASTGISQQQTYYWDDTYGLLYSVGHLTEPLYGLRVFSRNDLNGTRSIFTLGGRRNYDPFFFPLIYRSGDDGFSFEIVHGRDYEGYNHFLATSSSTVHLMKGTLRAGDYTADVVSYTTIDLS